MEGCVRRGYFLILENSEKYGRRERGERNKNKHGVKTDGSTGPENDRTTSSEWRHRNQCSRIKSVNLLYTIIVH